MDPITERAIAERAHLQLGLITAHQLRTHGLSRATVRRRVDAGLLIPVGRHAFRVGGAPPGPRVDVMAACLDLGGVASHRTGAWLHELLPHRPGSIDVTVPKGRSTGVTSTAGPWRIHTSTNLPRGDLTTTVDGIAVTSVARSLLGMAALSAAEVGDELLTHVVEEAVRRRLATDRWLWWLLEERRCRGRNGVRRFEEVLARRAQLGPTESWLERELLGLIDQAGLPRPRLQRKVRHRGAFVARVDFLYEPRLVIEAMGYGAHATRAQQDHDMARANELQLAGFEVLQLTYDHIVRQPAWVVDVLTTALVQQGLLPARAS